MPVPVVLIQKQPWLVLWNKKK